MRPFLGVRFGDDAVVWEGLKMEVWMGVQLGRGLPGHCVCCEKRRFGMGVSGSRL